jgi:hypothetical protein
MNPKRNPYTGRYSTKHKRVAFSALPATAGSTATNSRRASAPGRKSSSVAPDRVSTTTQVPHEETELSAEQIYSLREYQDEYHYTYLEQKFFGKLASENL